MAISKKLEIIYHNLRQVREDVNLPFGAGVQYNRLYLQPLQSVVTG